VTGTIDIRGGTLHRRHRRAADGGWPAPPPGGRGGARYVGSLQQGGQW